jgi:hypothetical protein
VDPAIEAAVVEMATDQPAWGQLRAANEQSGRGVEVSSFGFRNIWLRHDLTSTEKRLNPIERLSGEIKRRTDAAGIFPAQAAFVRLGGAILPGRSDEWAIQRTRCMTLEATGAATNTPAIGLSVVLA